MLMWVLGLYVVSFAWISLLCSAAPTSPAATCVPNFQGSAFTIANVRTNNRWALGAIPGQGDRVTAVADPKGAYTWRAEGDGQWPADSFAVKFAGAGANNRVVSQNAGNLVVSTAVSPVPTFDIKCAACASPGQTYAPGTQIGGACSFIFTSTGQYVNERAGGNRALGYPDSGAARFNLVAV